MGIPSHLLRSWAVLAYFVPHLPCKNIAVADNPDFASGWATVEIWEIALKNSRTGLTMSHAFIGCRTSASALEFEQLLKNCNSLLDRSLFSPGKVFLASAQVLSCCGEALGLGTCIFASLLASFFAGLWSGNCQIVFLGVLSELLAVWMKDFHLRTSHSVCSRLFCRQHL